MRRCRRGHVHKPPTPFLSVASFLLRCRKMHVHHSSAQKHPEAVLALLHAGASLAARDKLGYMAIHYAARSGSVQAVNLLLAHGDATQLRQRNHLLLYPHQVAERNAQRELGAALRIKYRHEVVAYVLSCGTVRSRQVVPCMPRRGSDLACTDQPPLWRHAVAAGAISLLLHSGYWAFYAQWWPPAARAAFFAGTTASISMQVRAILVPPHRLPPVCGRQQRLPRTGSSVAARKAGGEELTESSPSTCASQSSTAGAMLDDASPGGGGSSCLAAHVSSQSLSPRPSHRQELASDGGTGGGDAGLWRGGRAGDGGAASMRLGTGRKIEQGAGKGEEGWSGDGALRPLV
jgi:hypothetical protein